MSADIELKWEWPANRTIDNKLLVQIDDIKKQNSGFFGLLKSPSLVNNFPDPRILTGNIINSEDKLNGKTFTLTLPLLEMDNIKKNSIVVLGLVNNTTCICITPVDNKDVDLKNISCL